MLSPAIAITCKTPSNISKIDTSNVPPPRSSTIIIASSTKSVIPCASAAAVGSLINLRTFKPAILAASMVACLCLLLKYAGTLITASSHPSFKNLSASSFNCFNTKADKSILEYDFPFN